MHEDGIDQSVGVLQVNLLTVFHSLDEAFDRIFFFVERVAAALNL